MPKDLEQLVLVQLGKSLAEIDDIKRLRSRAESGVAVTIIEFESDQARRRHPPGGGDAGRLPEGLAPAGGGVLGR